VGSKGTHVVPWLFLIPLMPTDLVCLVCGASKMRFWQYMLIVCVFRPVEILLLISYNYIVPVLLSFEPIIVILIVNIVIIDLVLLFIYYKALMKLFKKYTKPFTVMFSAPIKKNEPTTIVKPDTSQV